MLLPATRTATAAGLPLEYATMWLTVNSWFTGRQRPSLTPYYTTSVLPGFAPRALFDLARLLRLPLLLRRFATASAAGFVAAAAANLPLSRWVAL